MVIMGDGLSEKDKKAIKETIVKKCTTPVAKLDKPRTLKGRFTAYWYDYPRGKNNRYGAGGWSKGAQKPRPQLVTANPSKVVFSGKSVILTINGEEVRKLKVTLVRNSTSEVIRDDYEIDRIKRDTLPAPLDGVK